MSFLLQYCIRDSCTCDTVVHYIRTLTTTTVQYDTAVPVTLLSIISVLFLQLQYRLYPAVPVTL